MLTPSQLEKIPEDIIKIYCDLESFIIEDIIKRIVKVSKMDSVKWQNTRGCEFIEANKIIKKRINNTLKKSEEQLDKVFKKAAQLSLKQDNICYRKAELQCLDLETSIELRSCMINILSKTKMQMKNMCDSLGFIQEAGNKKVFKGLKEYYISSLDLANIQSNNENIDYSTIISQAVRQIAKNGVNFKEYKNNRHSKFSYSVKRILMSGINEMVTSMTNLTMDINIPKDNQYVEVTAHTGSRESHKSWQGRVFKVQGKTDTYDNLFEVTALGKPDGLCSANCRHSYFPFILGVSTRKYSDKELDEIDGKFKKYKGKVYNAYEAKKMQRKIKRDIEVSKRKIIGYTSANLKNELTNSKIRFQVQKKELRDFSNAMGIEAK